MARGGWEADIRRQDLQYRATLTAISRPATAADVSVTLKLLQDTCVRRLVTLRRAGLAKYTGRNEAGRWQLTDAGRAALASSEPIIIGSRKLPAEESTASDAPWAVLASAFGMGSAPTQVSGRFVDRMGMGADA